MKTQFKRFSKSTISVLLAVCLLFSCMTVGLIATSAAQDDSESVGANISSGTTFYLDVTNFSGTYNSSYWLSLSGNGNTTATSSNTSGAGSYVPKSDSSWVEMTKVRGNIYSATTTAASSNGRVSFWSKSESGYDNVWEVNVSLGNLYDGTKNLFTISSGSSTHSDRRAVCFSGTWSVYDPANYHYECPASVLNGTDIMFYIQGYSGVNKLGNSSKTVSPGDFTQVDGSTTSYVKVAKSTAGNYQYITNNPGNWEGKQNTSIGSGSAGKLHVANDATSTTAAKTAATTLSSSSITTGTSSITLSTTCNSTTGVYNSLPLYYQYYLDDTYVASSEKSAKTTAQSFTLNTASLTAGTHTVETVLTDGNIFYIADTDTITVSAATPLTAPAITYGGSSATTQTMNAAKGSKATISWSAVSNADKYEVYKGSSKVATVSTTSYDIERGNSYGGAYTVKAVPASGDTSHSTSTASNSITFTFTKVTLPAPTVSGGNKTIASGTVTYSLSGGTGTLGTDYKYQHSGANNTSYSDVTGSTWTTGSMANAGTYEYKFKTVAVATDYYSDSSVTSDTITVRTAYQLRYYDNASATGTFSDDSSSTLAMTYDSTANAYYANVTVSNLTKFYYRIKTTNLSTQKLYSADWNNGYPNVYDVALGTTSSTGVDANTDVTSWDNKASLHYSGSSPKIIIWYNGTKTWITDNGTKHNVTITQPSTGGTIKVENATTSPQQFYEDDTVNYTVTASTGYVITSVTVGGITTNVDRKSSYEGSFTLTADTAITATVARQYDITANSATGGTYTVKRGGTAVTKFIPGDSLTLTPSPNTHYNFTNFTISGGKTVTLTANPSTLDTTGATGNITITPTWTAKSYTYTTNAYYSTTGASDSYTNLFSAGVSPASGSATNPAGVTVTAPATVTVSNVKYNFVDFVATSGSVTTAATSGTNKTTTFKPTAANAVCTARYKKVYTITSSVDDTGTGAGTVSTNKTEVEAGGSYDITATAKSGSAVESVKVNGTAKTNYSITGVSANQTVVAKFKSNVYLKGTMNATAWAGDVMQANSEGTTYTISDVVLNADTTYEFKHWVDSGGAGTYSTTVGTWTLNNIATHSTKSDGYGGTNLTITPSVKAKVTFVSDGTKFTSITAVPYNSTQYTVTLKKVAGATITSTYMGTEYTTASADATVQVYSGTAINFTVTADSDKYLTGITTSSGTLDPVFNATTHAATYTGAVTVTAATTITPAVADKLKVSWMSNKTDWGTVSVSPEYARPGDLITITCTPAAGTLSTLVAYDTTNQAVVKSWKRNGSGQMVVDKDQASQSSANQFTQVGLSGIAGSIYSFIKDAGEALGAKDDSAALGADDPLTFTMPSGAVSVTATYEEYVGTSEYYYHGRNTSGQAVSGYENEVMSEGMVNGQKYAYYNVTGRESVNYDQLFYVSKGGSYTDRWVYFNAKGETYGDWYEPYGTNVHAYFYNSSGVVGTAWPGATMTWVSDGNDNDKDSQWKIAIPSGATGVIFSNGKSGGDFKQTQDIDLTTTNGSYYPSGYSDNKYTVTQWTTPGTNSGIIAGTDYYWDTDVYQDQWYTGGFSNHNVNNDHTYAKPKDGNSQSFNECKDDYYIILLYPNTSYTFGLNGHDAETKTIGAKPMVLWSKELPGQSSVDVPTVKVYAKDGTIRRDGDKPERNDKTYSYFEQHANTYIYGDSGYANHIGVRSSHDGQSSEGSTGYNGYTYDYIAKFEKGETLYIQTNIDTSLRATHYLAAYCINGKTYALHAASESDDGVVTESFTVPEDWEDKYVEITPIYFLRDTEGTKMITFYIEGYDEEVMNAGWGNTPFVYPFYQDANFNYVSNINNAFGGYPGQPMVFYKGNYYIQLPDKITTTISTGQTGTATIKGVTLGNGYWDDIHLITGEVSSHFQTYDYDDLYKIYTEYPDQADHIICSFKYKTKKNNDEPASMTSSIAANYNTTNGNGWEVLTNYYGEPVDVFGNVLENDAKTLAEDIMAGRKSADTEAVVHAISQDYKSNSAGDYATEWVIYNTSGTKVVATSGGKTSIVPSALAINANTGSGELTANFDKYDNATKAFKSIYTALYNDTNVRNKPAVVTYEKSIYGGGDKADRCDARWYYSKKGQTITATTRIEYTDDGKTWNTDTYNTNTGTGSYTGAQAYFTGTATTATDAPTSAVSGKNTTTLDGTVGGGYYTFSAEGISGGTNGNYEFVGWYLLRDNYQNISSRSDYGAVSVFPSHAEMSKNGDIFVARFKKTATGTFDIYHEVHPQTTGYGNVSVSAVVINSSDAQVASYPAEGTTDHVTIPNTYIRSGEGYKVVATFTADPYHTSNFDAFYATVQDLLEGYKEYDFIDSIQINADATGGTATVTYNVDKMFSMASGQPVQTVTNVTHYSKFSLKTDLTYSLEYTFNTRYYGTKLYKYTNVKFTEQELRSYFLNQITDPNCDHIKLDKQFVKAKAPFESNFREDLTWVVDNVTFNNNNDPTIGYLTATQVSKKWATAMVYDFDNNGEMETTTMVAPIEKLFNASINTKPSYPTTEAEAQAIKDWSVDNDEMYHPLRTSYVPAGETSSAPLYIDHWDIYQLDSFTYKTVNNNPKMMDDGYNLDVDLSKSVLVAQAYSSRFNYVGYEDYVVVPVYNKDKVDRQGASDNRTDSSATLLTLTRNQWNANAAGNTDTSSYKDGADRVYVDFMLNYNYSVNVNGKQTNILLNSTGDNIKVGFIVRSYTWENEQKQYGKAQYVLVDKDQINDKNRMEYCFGFNNTANNRRAGLYYEFKPFIVDTANQTGSVGCDVKIGTQTYKALYADTTVKILDQVSFYQLGRL